MKKKIKIWIIIIVSIVIITNLPPVNYFLEENYSYQNNDASFIYVEQPGKGLDYEVGQIRFKRFQKQNPDKDQTLYRTFTLKPWKFWEWWQMLRHFERFKLPYYSKIS
ncbi:hypothetical protein ACTJKC_15255 [Pedobacter sp. 22226]|uniref:hypothetical protein n=1 Tax=Pedobacter sp. 22226 TaxID=3453894 RepID=UPI003F85C1A6